MKKFKRTKKIACVVLAAAIAMSVSSCGTNTTNKAAAKQIVIARNADSVGLDPVMRDDDVDCQMTELIVDTLVQSTNNGKKIVPCLAKSWDISNDKLTYTFHLRSGLKFSDGTPVKGEDWVYSLKRARDTQSSPWAFSLEDVRDITAPDNTTVVITLNQPSAVILSDLALFNAGVMPKSYCEKVGDTGIDQKPVGTGPYYLSEWKKGEYMIFKKNPYYWEKGYPKTDTLKIEVVPDDNARIMQLQGGQVDVVTHVPFNRISSLKSSTINTVNYQSTDSRYITINTTKKPLNNVKVRQALEYATDKKTLTKTVLFGNGTTATSFLSPSDPHFDSSLKGRAYDVSKAKELLKEAGVGSFSLSMVVPSGDTVAQQVATILKEEWTKIGVTIDITQLDSATAQDKFKKMDYDISFHKWINDITDTSEIVDYVCVYKNVQNYHTGWDNAQCEKLASDAESEFDESKRMDMYKQMQTIYQNETPMIPLFYVPFPVAMNKNVSGFVETSLGKYDLKNLVKN